MQTKSKDAGPFTKTRLLLAGAALLGLVWAGTFATFSDTGEADSTFTAGTLDLVVGGDPDDAYAFTTIEMTNMKPGDVKYAPLTMTNPGTLALRYSMTTSATNPDSKGLAGALLLEARVVATGNDCAEAGFNASTTVAIPSGALTAAAISNRPLSATGSETLCYRVTLPQSAGNELQGSTTVATFSFNASQV